MGLPSLKKIQSYLPFSYKNIFSNLIDKRGKTILDIGTGDGYLMEHVNSKGNYKVLGVEPYPLFRKLAMKSGAYDNVVQGKAEDIYYSSDTFDIVVSSQVLEYLTKSQGLRFINMCKKIAKRQVIIAAYIGDCKHVSAEGNPYQTSKSAWYPSDLKKLGFRVYGQGLKLIYRENGYRPPQINLYSILPMIFSYMMAPIVYLVPSIATHMIGIYRK